MKRRPHWDDDLVEAVTDHMYHCVDCLDEDYNEEDWRERWTYGVIAAVEDWHEKFVMHGAFRVLAERAASAEADRDRLANQLLNEVPDSYIQMKARALTAEATIQRVRELHGRHDPNCPYGEDCAGAGLCLACREEYPCATIRALDGLEGRIDD